MNKHIQIAESLTNLLDTKFSIFGIRFGLDPLLDVIPFVGAHVSSLLSLYMIWIGIRIGLTAKILLVMLWNILIDYLIGLIPYVGIFGDIWFKSNVKNLHLIKKYIGKDVIFGDVI